MNQVNFLNVFQILLRHARTLIFVGLAAAVISFAVSFLLKEKFKSSAVIYPVNMYQNSDESNSEQLLQYLLSEDVKNQLAFEFNLYKHYGVDTVNEKGGRALFNYAFRENVAVSPTLYESIEISVKDQSPVLAQQINQRLIELTNELIKANKKKIVRQYLEKANYVLKRADHELDSINERIVDIKRRYNIIDEKYQGKYVSREIVKGKSTAELTKQSEGLRDKISELRILQEKAKSMMKSYAEMKQVHDKYLLDAQGEIDFVLYVSRPDLPDKRCYPVRWIIVLASTVSALMLAVVIILIRYRSRNRA